MRSCFEPQGDVSWGLKSRQPKTPTNETLGGCWFCASVDLWWISVDLWWILVKMEWIRGRSWWISVDLWWICGGFLWICGGFVVDFGKCVRVLSRKETYLGA